MEDGPEQSGPPFAGPTFDLVRVLLPEPQVLEQELHDPHGTHVQGTASNINRSVNFLMNAKRAIPGQSRVLVASPVQPVPPFKAP